MTSFVCVGVWLGGGWPSLGSRGPRDMASNAGFITDQLGNAGQGRHSPSALVSPSVKWERALWRARAGVVGSNDITQGRHRQRPEVKGCRPAKAEPAGEARRGQSLRRATPITLLWVQTRRSHGC